MEIVTAAPTFVEQIYFQLLLQSKLPAEETHPHQRDAAPSKQCDGVGGGSAAHLVCYGPLGGQRSTYRG